MAVHVATLLWFERSFVPQDGHLKSLLSWPHFSGCVHFGHGNESADAINAT